MTRTPKQKPPKAPKHLRVPTRRWFEHVVSDWTLEQHHVRLLVLAGEAWDRATQAREAIEVHGLVYVDRFGAPRTRPEVAVERDSRLAFARLVRELALDIDEPSNDVRPPTIAGNAGLKVR